MIDIPALQRATIFGSALQIAMVVAGHYSPWIAQHVFMLGGMAISTRAGLHYARQVARGYGPGALGGAIAGGACAAIGIALSVALGDTAPLVLALGTAASCVTGALGGVAGAALRKTRPAEQTPPPLL